MNTYLMNESTMSPQQRTAISDYMGSVWNNPSTTERQRKALLRYSRIVINTQFAQEAPRCVECKQPFIYVPNFGALIEGHIYSGAGLREVKITQLCEFCFDEITRDDVEYEPPVEFGGPE